MGVIKRYISLVSLCFFLIILSGLSSANISLIYPINNSSINSSTWINLTTDIPSYCYESNMYLFEKISFIPIGISNESNYKQKSLFAKLKDNMVQLFNPNSNAITGKAISYNQNTTNAILGIIILIMTLGLFTMVYFKFFR